jgi:hypothetical protein
MLLLQESIDFMLLSDFIEFIAWGKEGKDLPLYKYWLLGSGLVTGGLVTGGLVTGGLGTDIIVSSVFEEICEELNI